MTVVSSLANLSKPPASLLYSHRKHALAGGYVLGESRSECLHDLEYVDYVCFELPRPICKIGELVGQSGIKGLSDLLWLADSAAFDQNRVELVKLIQVDQFFEQIFSEGAADAAILKRNHLLLALGQMVSSVDLRGIDVDSKRTSKLIFSPGRVVLTLEYAYAPISLTMTAIRWPCCSSSTCLRRVVFPLPWIA